METPHSFAPLAARLAAHAAAIRPLGGARNDWDKVGALLVCLVLEFLIALCEALDKRAAADAARLAAAPAPRAVKANTVAAPRARSQATMGEMRAPGLAVAPDAQATALDQADAPSGTTQCPAPARPRLVWSRDPGPVRAAFVPPWRPLRETRLSHRRSRTPMLLRYNN